MTAPRLQFPVRGRSSEEAIIVAIYVSAFKLNVQVHMLLPQLPHSNHPTPFDMHATPVST